jgi:hypothetical protein
MTPLKCIWEAVMWVATLAYTGIVMYEYNRGDKLVYSQVAAPPPTYVTPTPALALEQAQADVSSLEKLGLLAGSDANTPFFTLSQPSGGSPESCKTDLGDWSSDLQSLVNMTMVFAIILALDQVRIVVETWHRRGFLKYVSCPDNLFNVVLTAVTLFSAVEIEVPNAVGNVCKRLSRMAKGYAACVGTAEEEEDEDDLLSKYDFSHIVDKIIEVFIALLMVAELVQAIMLAQTECHSGPTLTVTEVGKTMFNLSNWDTQDQQLCNIAALLSFIFVVNVVLEWSTAGDTCVGCSRGCRGFFKDISKVHILVIAIQTQALQFGYPIPTSFGRIVRPVFYILNWGTKTSEVYEKLDEEFGLPMKKLAPEEGVGVKNDPLLNCCGRGPCSRS